ncbi:folate family ECF transporter S component [Lutispora sp.]|uniref:folate family ECF transporter S component n=1 Tax=Lutispora sp. TaxID=2828727 RepID=UPI002B216573|nr:folate family ECF transporter S component [Lutispora sp.]MEA4963210.1 folate family ECF transporter S component [Lutispora sp.]
MNKAEKRLSTLSMAVGGLLAGMSIILTRFFAVYLVGGSVRLSFGDIPILLAGMLLGPVIGGLTGAIADLAGMLIFGGGGFPYFPGFTLSAMLTGAIPGLIFYRTKSNYSLWKIVLTIMITSLLVSLGLGTLWLTILLKKGFLVLLPARIIARAIMAPIEVAVLYLILSRVRFIQ